MAQAATATPAPTNLWALVERQAADRPDGVLAVDEQDRVLTFGELRTRAERAAAGLQALRRRRGHAACRGSCRPGSRASCSSARSPGSAPCRTRACRSTASASCARSSPRSRRASSWCPARGAASTIRRWRARVLDELRASHGLDTELVVVDPDASRRRSRRAPTAAHAHAAGRRAVAVDLLHVGHDRGPQGRAATPTRPSVTARLAVVDRPRDDRRRPLSDHVPVHPHRRYRHAW